MKKQLLLFLCSLFCNFSNSQLNDDEDISIDPYGYITFCPCMGRFGNQADQFLGTLGFSRALNRTLVLPPWIEYRRGAAKSIQVPFTNYIQIEPLRQFHKVIEMEQFMIDIAPKIWPPEKRTSFCYMARHNSTGCEAKKGNPFGPFWDHFDVNFVDSQLYGQHLSLDVYHDNMAPKWNKIYTPKTWPVLAFAASPGSFPIAKENVVLHKYLKWNLKIEAKAKIEINKLPRGPFIAIHLRNGIDWERACEFVNRSKNMFASPQCLGYKGEHGENTIELCLPSKETIVKQLKRTIKNMGAKSVFVASDNDHMLPYLTKALSKLNTVVYKMPFSNPHIELAVMGLSNHFIGNCVSTFTAFVKRERDGNGFPSSFWSFPLESQKKKYKHTEL